MAFICCVWLVLVRWDKNKIMILDFEWRKLDKKTIDGSLFLGCSFKVHKFRGEIYDTHPTTCYLGKHTNNQGKNCYRDIKGQKLNITHYMPLPSVANKA